MPWPNKTLIMADSRGAGLAEVIESYVNIGTVRVEIHRGAGFEHVARNSIPTLRSFNPDLIILFAGVCNLTKRNRRTKVTTMIQNDLQAAVEGVTAALARALTLLNEEGYTTISVATLAGVDLRRYNGYPVVPRDPDQIVLNHAIVRINRHIVDTNKINNVPTTWTASIIHAYYRGSYHHLYNKLSDGCHPTAATNRYWARMVVKAIKLTRPRI